MELKDLDELAIGYLTERKGFPSCYTKFIIKTGCSRTRAFLEAVSYTDWARLMVPKFRDKTCWENNKTLEDMITFLLDTE